MTCIFRCNTELATWVTLKSNKTGRYIFYWLCNLFCMLKNPHILKKHVLQNMNVRRSYTVKSSQRGNLQGHEKRDTMLISVKKQTCLRSIIAILCFLLTCSMYRYVVTVLTCPGSKVLALVVLSDCPVDYSIWIGKLCKIRAELCNFFPAFGYSYLKYFSPKP